MSVFYIMVPASILLALLFLGAFFWSVKSGQYEDTYTPSVRILFEETPAPEAESVEEEAPEPEAEK